MKVILKQLKTIYLIITIMVSGIAYGQMLEIAGKAKSAPNFGQTKNGPVLYDQMYSIGYSWIYSNSFTNTENALESSELADDFYVPENETWNIGSVAVAGAYADLGVGPVDTISIIFYDDFPDKPGDTLYEFYDIVDIYTETELVEGNTMTYFEIQLPETVTLAEGHYWMSVRAKGSYNDMGKWGWSDHWNGNAPETKHQWHFRNQSDYPDWTSAWDVVIIWTNWDLSFKLFSEAYENDLAVVDITSPTDGNLTASELVTIKIKNEGTESQTGFDVKYEIDGTEVIENFGAETIEPDEFFEFSFVATADFSEAGLHEITASTMLEDDDYADNDAFTKEILSYGTIYEMENGVTDATITTCGATMVDPGGMYGDFDQDDYGRITIYPETEGTQVRLTFVEFDIDWGDMTFYDGDDITDPSLGTYNKGTGAPDVITAFNSDGVLTVDFEASGWSNASGWIAYMSCFTPEDDDFAVLDLVLSKNTVVTGEFITATATIQNYGNTTQSKDVSFTANEIEFGPVNTGDLDLFEITTIEATWNPMEMGVYEIIASVPEDDGIDNNNSRSLFQEVGEANFLYEGFENDEWPPEGWEITEGYWNQWSSGPMFGSYHAECSNGPGYEDTLISPMLNILDGDEISYYLKGNPWWYGDCEIIHKYADSDEWTSIIIHDGVNLSWASTLFAQDLSDYAGIGQVGFVSLGDVNFWALGRVELDEINGPALHVNNNDLAAVEFVGPITPEVNQTATYTLTIKNTGELPQIGSTYSVMLMQEPGIDLVTVEGVDLMPLESADILLEFDFPIAGAKTIYGEIDLENDDYPDNNISLPLHIYSLQEGTTTIDIGDGVEEEWQFPLSTTSGYKLSESLYNATELGVEEGNITGISYFYKRDEIYNSGDVPFQMWVGESDLFEFELGSDNWVVPSELTLVAESTFEVYPGENMLYIPFDFPYSYGGENLVVMIYQAIEDFNGSTIWYHHETPGVWTKWASELNFEPDPEDPSDLYTHDELLRPNTVFYISPLLEYCIPETVNGTGNGYYVDGVVFGDIDNTGTGSAEGLDYNNYSSEISTNLAKGGYYELTIQPVAAGENTVCAWIDYNSDLDFEDEGEMICRISHDADVTEIKIPVVVSEDTEVGIKRLRIRSGMFDDEFDACLSISDGETEDYSVNIIEATQEFYPVDDFTATLADDGTVDLSWNVPVNPGRAYLEGFEMSTWPPEIWEVKTSTTIDGELLDPVGETWVQYSDDIDYVYNGMYSAHCPSTATDFNWLISPEFMPFGDDEVSFMINYNSDESGYSKFYVVVGTEDEMTTVLEYTDETTWSNNYDSLVTIGLNQFAGKYIRIAFVTENNSAYDIAIDDIVVTAGQTLDSKAFDDLTKYYLYRNGSLFYFITDPSVTTHSDEVSETENYEYCITAHYGDNISVPVCDDVTYVAPLTPPVNVMATANGSNVEVTWLAPGEGIFRLMDDFESYNLTDQLTVQNNDDYNTWSNVPGDETDPYLVVDQAYEGSQSLEISNLDDLMVKFGNKTDGKYSYNFRLFVPEGFGAYFSVFQRYEYSIEAEWGFQAFFNSYGEGEVDGGGDGIAAFTYDYDVWMYIEMVIDLDADWAEFYIDGELIHEYAWSGGIYGTGSINELTAAGLYAYNANGTPKFYVDNLQLIQLFDVEGVDTYNVYKNGETLGTADNTKYEDMDVSSGTHTYCVSALYDEGESDTDCGEVTVISEIQVPQNFDAVVQGADVLCSWDAIEGKDLLGYRVYKNDEDISGLISETDYLDVEVTVGEHEYYVKAEFDSGTSEASNSVIILITGMEINLADVGISVYPNPVSDILTVKAELTVTKIRIINSTGQVVYEDQNIENNIINLNFDSFLSGIYYIRINTENGWAGQKIIKK